MGSKMGAPRTFDKVANIFIDNPNKKLTLEALAIATGLSEKQVIDAIRYAQANGDAIGKDIETLIRARTWIYHSNDSSSKAQESVSVSDTIKEDKENVSSDMTFESVGHFKNGDFVVKDPAGNLYKLVKI